MLEKKSHLEEATREIVDLLDAEGLSKVELLNKVKNTLIIKSTRIHFEEEARLNAENRGYDEPRGEELRDISDQLMADDEIEQTMSEVLSEIIY